MSMLAELQAHLAAHIRHSSNETSELLASVCKSADNEELRARLAVYQNNFYASLTGVLQDTFPTIYKLCGNEFFSVLARAYIEAAPPESPLLFAWGESFPDFVRGFPALKDFAYMSEVATLEWRRHQAYYAAEKTSLTAEDFAEFNPQQLSTATLALHPSSHILISRYAVYSIWESNQQEASAEQNEKPLCADQAECVLVYRNQAGIQTLNISLALATFLNKLQQEHSLADAMEAATAIDKKEFNPSSAFGFLIQSGLCTEIKGTELKGTELKYETAK